MASDWPWLRLYSEARTDKKLQALSDAMHRVWFNLLCYAGEQSKRGEIREQDEFLLAIECSDGDEPLLRATLETLERLGIVCIGDGEDDHDTIRFLNWDKRQYDKASDRPEATAERKRKSRALKEESAQSRDVTPSHAPDTEEELDTDTEREHTHDAPAARVKGYPPAFERFWTLVVRKEPSKAKAYEAWLKAVGRATDDTILLGLERVVPVWEQFDDRSKIPHITTWLNQDRWTVERPTGPARASPASNRSIWDDAIVNARARDLADESGRNGASTGGDRYPLLADPEYRRPKREPDGGDVDAGASGHPVEAVWREGP